MKPGVQIRVALPDDAGKIAEVIRAAFAPFENFYTPQAFAATTPGAEKIRARFEEKGVIWAALKSEEIVGTVSVLPEGRSLYLRSMAVLPAAQGLGVGRALLETVESYAARNGFEKLFLYTVPFLTGAIRLYEQAGFARGEDFSPDEFYGTPGFAMEKDLGDL